jgi:hypothetical protein
VGTTKSKPMRKVIRLQQQVYLRRLKVPEAANSLVLLHYYYAGKQVVTSTNPTSRNIYLHNNVAEMLELNSRIKYFQYTALFEWFSPGLDSIMNCEYKRFLVQFRHNSKCILQETVFAHITVFAFFVS